MAPGAETNVQRHKLFGGRDTLDESSYLGIFGNPRPFMSFVSHSATGAQTLTI